MQFLSKMKVLTTQDIDLVWQSSIGKHEAIVQNIHMLLSEITEHLNAQHLDRLFQVRKASPEHS